MPKPTRANVKPEILIWARESAGYTLEEVSRASGLAKIAEWEAGKIKPTINQLRTLSAKYRRPLAVFYLQDKPVGFEVMRDFRRLPGEGLRKISPALSLQIRAARERREIALDLYTESDPSPYFQIGQVSLTTLPEEAGSLLRQALGISFERQSKWRDARVAFNSWRDAVESAGVLVFQFDKVDLGEVSGFAVAEDSLPVVAVNRADVFRRRIFSLLHELAHVALKVSGISDLSVDNALPPEEQKVEVFCNAVAAAALMPSAEVRNVAAELGHNTRSMIWSDQEISEIAKIFSVSREAVVRRFLSLGMTDSKFYAAKRKAFQEEYQGWREERRKSFAEKEFRGRNMPNETISFVGRAYARLVIQNYYRERITLRDVSDYLGVKVRHIPAIEKSLSGGGAV